MTKLSTSFSKASFVAKDQAEEVDLDDPDFWQKAIGLVEQAPEEEEEVSVGVSCVLVVRRFIWTRATLWFRRHGS